MKKEILVSIRVSCLFSHFFSIGTIDLLLYIFFLTKNLLLYIGIFFSSFMFVFFVPFLAYGYVVNSLYH